MKLCQPAPGALQLAGELTIFEAEEIARELRHHVGRSDLTIDLSKTERIDGAGLQLLISLARSQELLHSRVTFVGASADHQRLLRLGGLAPQEGEL